MNRLEAASLMVGVLFVVVSLLAVDWRLAFALFGALLMVAALDIKPRRRT